MGFGIRLEINGLKKLLQGLAKLPLALDGEMAQAIKEGLAVLAGELAIYPAAIAGSRYRRTGLLGQRWSAATKRVRRRGLHRLEGRMTNTRPGVTYVQLGSEQAAVHRGRWRTAEQVIEEQQMRIDGLLRQAGEKTLRGIGT